MANIFIWTWLVYGGFYIFVFKDWAMGFCLSVLSAGMLYINGTGMHGMLTSLALGVAQFLTVIVAVQWIEAFIIMALLFLASLALAVPGVFGKDPFKRGTVVEQDREREPLLGDENA